LGDICIFGGLFSIEWDHNIINLVINLKMDKKSNLLSNLKQQVLALKNQLEGL
jgi:hypothetical protein